MGPRHPNGTWVPKTSVLGVGAHRWDVVMVLALRDWVT